MSKSDWREALGTCGPNPRLPAFESDGTHTPNRDAARHVLDEF